MRLMSALPPKADIAESDWHVRFVPKADIRHLIRLPDWRALKGWVEFHARIAFTCGDAEAFPLLGLFFSAGMPCRVKSIASLFQ